MVFNNGVDVDQPNAPPILLARRNVIRDTLIERKASAAISHPKVNPINGFF
jgi:hypothetical protein